MTALFLSVMLLAADPTPPNGSLPVGADGKPLNLDFETGTLKDWTAVGDAFKDQPIKGDTVFRRRADNHSRHQGEYWIGGFEKVGDKPLGTLTSVPFKVTHPWASFLVGGGPWAETCVEVVTVPKGDVILRASGREAEDLERVAVDLMKYAGQQIQVRIVDKHPGHWWHINFDDFRFHSEKPKIPERAAPPKTDEFKFAGLKPEAAAAAMTVPEGFEVRLFAGEPDVHQPIAMCLDDRGRLWVAEAYTYPKRHPHAGPIIPDADRKKGDRILIFEDTDGDGKHDKKTVFLEGLNLVSGLEVGFGGVWIGAAPYLLFVPHDEKTDKPGEVKILLDGWGYEDTHETLNSFLWGPDGWLYGCHGVFTHSKVGKPNTPDKDRTKLNAGVWRYHPTKHVFEVFAHGTSNPWGLDYNDVGDFFASACVIPHCFHIVQGGRYQRQAGAHFNPYTYDDIKTIADHLHWQGANQWAANNKSGHMGGGHAHCGLMCYLGGTWPKEYRGQLFMGNVHGRRLNVDVPRPKGSGYVASHGKDFLQANDAWARFINLRYGPDGNVYLIDWYDKQACHNGTPEVWDRTNGRIYKIAYKGSKPVAGVDLKKCSDAELVKYQLHDNDWYVRHARRILQERADEFSRDAKRSVAVREELTKIAISDQDEKHRLRGLWSLFVTRNTSVDDLKEWLVKEPSPAVREWMYRIYLDTSFSFESVSYVADGPSVVNMAGQVLGLIYQQLRDRRAATPVDRRGLLAFAMQVTPKHRWVVLESLIADVEPDDHNLPYLTWYAAEPLAELDPGRALRLAAMGRGMILPLMARRVAALSTPEAHDLLVELLLSASTDDIRLAYLNGLADDLKGKPHSPMPKAWPAAFTKLVASANSTVRSQAITIAVSFGDPKAIDMLRRTVTDLSVPTSQRLAALTALVGTKNRELPPVLHAAIGDSTLRAPAIRGLAAFDDKQTPSVLLGEYRNFTPAEKRDALNTLAARPAYAQALLDAIAAKKLPAADVTAEIVRQLRNLNDAALNAKIAAVWGTVRETPADRKKLIADWRAKLEKDGGVEPRRSQELALGRAVFAKTCQQCHTLYGVGGKVGPDITGANRADLGYVLENILDPSAVIPKEYAATKLDLADGRVVTGIVKEQVGAVVTVLTANEVLTLRAADIEKRTPSELSMMPDDVIKTLAEPELRALVAYLRNPSQVPILATADNVKDFFNGKDLTGWDGTKELWSVENGEIIGKTATGLKRNEFLKSQFDAGDFRLSVKVKLTPNKENSGIQFRSEPLPDGEMRGPQADIGAGWWGKLYEESGRGLLWKESGEMHVKEGEWNEYVVEAKGNRVKTWINGQLCVDLEDEKLSRRGLIAFQMHSGGAMEVRFKEVKLEVLK